MYYEEKMILGRVNWRNDPNGDFTPYTIEELSRRYMDLQDTLKEIRKDIQDIKDIK